ncbi:MAG: DUF4861 domain-containing protein [Clostridiales bacterium]|nr:DUF4861 domain-containing protein [Clostridiales bacterium]
MEMLKITIQAILLLLASACSNAITVKVTAPSQAPESEHIVEIDHTLLNLSLDRGIMVTDQNGNELPHQLTHNGNLLFPATLRPGSEALFKIIETDTKATFDTIALAQLRPDKQDDLAWENSHGGYRLYGPSYHRGNGPVRGYDIWTKSVSHPTLAQRYENDHKGISYHVDQGDGMDPYTVGKTLGAGLACLLDSSGNFIFPKGYNKATILDNGPLRLTVVLDIDPVIVDSDTVTETRTITLDRNSWLNTTTVSYNGLTHPATIASGIVVHRQNPDAYRTLPDVHAVTYDDLTDNPTNNNGTIYIGVIDPQASQLAYSPLDTPAGDALGHIMATHTFNPTDTTYTYYWGSGWSKGGVESSKQWDELVRDHYRASLYPYTIEIVK